MNDPYVYKGTEVLINKFGIKNLDALSIVEKALCTEAEIKGLPEGKFDFNHLKSIHKALFGGLYSWAGQIRTVNITKTTMFCATDYINTESYKLFNQLSSEKLLTQYPTKSEIIPRLAYYFAEINAIHPFREGNGRTNRAFLEQLAQYNGYELDFTKVNRTEYLQSSINSHAGDNFLLEKIFNECLCQKSIESLPKFILYDNHTGKQVVLNSNNDVLKYYEQHYDNDNKIASWRKAGKIEANNDFHYLVDENPYRVALILNKEFNTNISIESMKGASKQEHTLKAKEIELS